MQASPVKWFPGVDVTKLYPSLKGKSVLITGGGGSLGLEASTQIAKLGAKVYLSDVRQDLAISAVSKIKTKFKEADVVATPDLDLNSINSIRTFVEWFGTVEEELDILLNNTGTAYLESKPFATEDGFAARSQVNFLGHYVLTRLLENFLVSGSRVVTIASVFHRFGVALPPEDLMEWEGGTYPNCKLALVMFTKLLQEKWSDKGVVCLAVDPGAVFTGIWSSSELLSTSLISAYMKFFFAPPEDAVASYIHTVACSDVSPGGYYSRGLFTSEFITCIHGDGPVSTLRLLVATHLDWLLRRLSRGWILSTVQKVPVSPEASKMHVAEELWAFCARVIGLPS